MSGGREDANDKTEDTVFSHDNLHRWNCVGMSTVTQPMVTPQMVSIGQPQCVKIGQAGFVRQVRVPTVMILMMNQFAV